MTRIMVREWAISIYLFIFKVVFSICNLFPQKNKTVFVTSFGDNALYVIQELEKQTDEKIVILHTKQCKTRFNNHSRRTIILFELSQPFQWIRSIYHLATSPRIFIDNYFGFLAVTNFKPNVICTQLWHAAGAIKQFGLKDPSNHSRSKKAIDRFKKVYQNFDYVVVGSEKMVDIFEQSFGLPSDRMLRTGIPRTDFFFDSDAIDQAKQMLQEQYPVIQHKKVLLYAPTYRDQELDISHIELDIKQMYYELKDDYVLFLRLHPAVSYQLPATYSEFIYDVTHIENVNHLLIVTDILITDYSSIPFEYSLLRKPMIFFAYDLENYKKERGFWESYENLAPGPIVDNTTDLIQVVKSGLFDLTQVNDYADLWNEYSNGQSSKKLIEALFATPDRETY